MEQKPSAADEYNVVTEKKLPKQMPALFTKLWPIATDDNPLTLFGFRRFRTTHLLNLRFLEEEIAGLDRKFYQAGLQLDVKIVGNDKLGVGCARRDKNALKADDFLDEGLVLKLRDLLKQYGELKF